MPEETTTLSPLPAPLPERTVPNGISWETLGIEFRVRLRYTEGDRMTDGQGAPLNNRLGSPAYEHAARAYDYERIIDTSVAGALDLLAERLVAVGAAVLKGGCAKLVASGALAELPSDSVIASAAQALLAEGKHVIYYLMMEQKRIEEECRAGSHVGVVLGGPS